MGRRGDGFFASRAKASFKNFFFTNTYAQRVSKNHSYDYESSLQNVDIKKSLKEGELSNVDQPFNMFLEEKLGKIHSLSSMFMIVNTSLPQNRIIFVSNEFTDFYGYDRNEIFLADARLHFMCGGKTSRSLFREIKYTLETTTENTLEHVLYTKGNLPVHTTIGLLKVMSAGDGRKDEYFAMTFDPFKANAPQDDEVPSWEEGADNFVGNWELGAKSLVAPVVKFKDKVLKREEKSIFKDVLGFRLLSDSALRSIFDWISLIFTIWAVFSVPLQYVFDENIYYSKPLDIATDLVLALDLILNFRTTYVNQDGLVIMDGKKMASHYLRGWFFLDLIASFPWQIFQIIIAKIWPHAAGLHKLLRGFKCLRVVRMVKVITNRDNYTRNGPASLSLIIVFFLSLGHIFACFWYILGKSHYEQFTDTTKSTTEKEPWKGWITYYLIDNQYDRVPGMLESPELMPGCYSASLYFIMTIFCTVGFGNISPWNTTEQIFCIFVMLLGAFLYAIVFGSATNKIMQMGAQQSRFLDQQQNLEQYTSVNKFPLELKNRVEDYFFYQWYNSKGIEPSKMMSNWPRNLKEDTCLFMHRVLFAEWPVFSNASTGCRRALSSLIERHGVTPGDFITHTEDCVESIFFVVKGHLKILRDGAVVGILTKGDTFGAKWWPTEVTGKATADVMAMTYAELEVLSHESLREILIKFPDFWDIWVEKLDITFELAEKDDIFAHLPEDLRMHITMERMPAHQAELAEEGDDEKEREQEQDLDVLLRTTRSLIAQVEERQRNPVSPSEASRSPITAPTTAATGSAPHPDEKEQY